ncbi:cell growth-regulating nucleolar protein [Zeugodacus cucurbitae]|uniref:cell growth-regulating nucleolar protein n=1 Tax=Zeugodacus cucurbitae TaxID=28588 RepID=UPI0023D921FB|nr:cell growth-regulating nucleolar protein [Zeugodacus cucurbitae]
MVFFTCNHCGESVKKPAVEKHYNTRCRGAPKNVSCMDCLKDFGDNYVAHTKCITELQKYSGKDYVHKEAKNSGAKKQEGWMDIIRAILDSSEYKLREQTREAFQRLQSVDNVPRKKAKFQNFVKNCMHMPMRLAEEVWKVLEKEQEKMKVAKQQENDAAAAKKEEEPKQNGVKREATEEAENQEPVKKKSKKNKTENGSLQGEESIESAEPKKKKSKKQELNVDSTVAAETNGTDEPAKKKSKKQKHIAQEAESEQVVANDTTLEANTEANDDFEWSEILNKIVQKNADGIALEKLKKRVLKKYAAKIGNEELTEKQQKKFEKKFSKNLKKCSAVQVIGELVKAC